MSQTQPVNVTDPTRECHNPTAERNSMRETNLQILNSFDLTETETEREQERGTETERTSKRERGEELGPA